jgi:polyketide biosynthesis enoyl-CoA hydratase PksI
MELVVNVTDIGHGIAKITMADKNSRNAFSHALIEGLRNCFFQVQNDERFKIIILTGYDNYFACGGTKEELLQIQKGEITFDQLDFFRLALDCPIPVISAMQGHALGGGFIFGLYADFVVLGRENIYTTNFMHYGFTPGMGATLIAPEKLGNALATELLFSANNYRGGELQQRGVPFLVVPKTEVLDKAIALAKSLAEKPRLSLTTLKHHMAHTIRERLPATIEQELKMHNITFKQPEVIEKIERIFGEFLG